MGYSCTKKAADTLERIGKTFATDGNPNILTIRGKQYFFERGREQNDGAITGALFLLIAGSWCEAVGSVRINSDGTIARFPKLSANVRKQFSIHAAGYDYDHFGDVIYTNVSVEKAVTEPVAAPQDSPRHDEQCWKDGACSCGITKIEPAASKLTRKGKKS